MQIDFHHAVTYVVARMAGFDAMRSTVIAHSAQYVDDATKAGEIEFDNGMRFTRLSSAHKMMDYANFSDLSNCEAWLPFHFLPGNLGEPAPAIPPEYSKEEFLLRCVCKPNSHVAQDMMRAVIERQNRPYALYRLGIAAHVYVDTWAHQEFVGFHHRINNAGEVVANDAHHSESFEGKMKRTFGAAWDRAKGFAIGEVWPLGHGAVVSYPDRPYLKWSYINGLGKEIKRDNTDLFVQAATNLYNWFRRYLDYSTSGEKVFSTVYSPPPNFDLIGKYLAEIVDEDETARHDKWLELIQRGTFGFSEAVVYADDGSKSWKVEALKIVDDIGHSSFPIPFPHRFASSHWKLFHDALQAQRFFVLHELLPRYGLLAT